MKIIRNKKSIARKVVLSSLTLSAFISVSSYCFFDQYNQHNNLKESLFFEENSKNSENYNLPETGGRPTSFALKATRPYNPYSFQVFPLENSWQVDAIGPDGSGLGNFKKQSNLLDFIEIQGDVTYSHLRTLDVIIKPLKMISEDSTNTDGEIKLDISISPWYDSTGRLNQEPGKFSFLFGGFKSLPAATLVTPNSGIYTKLYASDIIANKGDANNPYPDLQNYFSINNPSVNPSGWPYPDVDFSTKFKIIDIRADNLRGEIIFKYSLQNFVTEEPAFIQSVDEVFPEITIGSFFKVGGPTTLEPIEKNTKLIVPSNIVGEIYNDESQWSQYFNLINPIKNLPTNDQVLTTIKNITILDANNEKGTVDVALSISGGYIDSNNLPVKDPTQTTINITVSGFKQIVGGLNDPLLPVWIGIGGGGFAIILIVVVILIAISQKKKNEAAKKKKSMEDRLSMASSRPANVGLGGATGVAPGASKPGMGPVGNPTGKYVPPTISVPKSNAPQAKRPAGPLPVKK